MNTDLPEKHSLEHLHVIVDLHQKSLLSIGSTLKTNLEHLKEIYQEIDDLKESINCLKKLV